MKRLIFLAALVAFGSTACRKIIVDDNATIINNPGPTPPPSGVQGRILVLKGRIDTSLTIRKIDQVTIEGRTWMVNNSVLTIEAGTTIRANFTGADVAALVITRGARIVANGTANEPIVFTSASPTPRSGDWGGIVLCGRAPINTSSTAGPGTVAVEGGINNASGDGIAGGTNPDDNSGTLRYVRIEYAGYAFNPDQEINSLTMAAVGRGTTIEYVQVAFARDDAFEWFGGTVNCRYLVAYKTQDDDFDTDNGYSGTVQFGIVFRDSAIADISRCQAFESDNDGQGTTASPKTTAIFSNITAIGPRATTANLGNSLFLGGAQIRRNSASSIFNSVFLGWPAGIIIDDSRGTTTFGNVVDSSLRIRGNLIAGTAVPFAFTPGTNAALNQDSIRNFLSRPFFSNQVLPNNEQVGYTRPFDYVNPDFAPFASANISIPGFPTIPNPIRNGWNFTDAKLQGNNAITVVDFRGGIGPSGEFNNWYRGWTRFGN